MEKYNQDAEQTEQKFTEMKSNARSQLIHNQQKETQLKVAQVSLLLYAYSLYLHFTDKTTTGLISLNRTCLHRNARSLTTSRCCCLNLTKLSTAQEIRRQEYTKFSKSKHSKLTNSSQIPPNCYYNNNKKPAGPVW